jgi:large conductance mechanosensitive channel
VRKVAGEFKDFIARGNVMDLAVAVVLGAAFTKIVDAIVAGLIMPLIGKILPGGDWQTWTVTSLNLELGRVLAAIVNFLVIALVVFLIVKKLVGRFRAAPAAGPAMKDCPECLEKIPALARRCRACTSPIAA